ncbi:MAG: aspartate--tRNA ligase [Treponema sp.]|jgi:aspartyl-tRNA synthetase|nr:aspartate--tRNA ligase [Treponema sp.]
MKQMKRTNTCGALGKADAGQTVVLNGWVHRKRDHGGISFINLRDRYGITQVVVDPADGASAELLARTAELRNEFCVAVEGMVRERPASMINADMATGQIEVLAATLVILNRCEVLPFQINEEGLGEVNEELRLKYRYLDLRSAAMQQRLRLRSSVTFAVREWMTAHGFYEIETPTFIKSTPEGARDYLVPSRLYAGKFYALPQSPQLYKQLLMVAGFDKYFQIARCYRDEDARGDRQPEFTQIDIEMSFVDRDDVLGMTEALMGHVFDTCLGVKLPAQFPRLTHEEALERYGSDKPDLRFALEMRDFAPYIADGAFQAFKDALALGEEARAAGAARGVTVEGGGVKAIVVPGAAAYSRKQIEALEAHAKIYKAKGLAWMKVSGTENVSGTEKASRNDAPFLLGHGMLCPSVPSAAGNGATKDGSHAAGAGSQSSGDVSQSSGDVSQSSGDISQSSGAVSQSSGDISQSSGAISHAAGAGSHAAVSDTEKTADTKKGSGTLTLEGGVSKFFTGNAAAIIEGLGAKSGDLILICADAKRHIANIALGAVRSKLGKDLSLCAPGTFAFAWIVDFPLFEFNEEAQRWEAAHHMFSYPQERYHATLESDPGAVKGDLYDLVLNGYEQASGSIRIHEPALQKRIFTIVGMSDEEAERKFGFLTNAFKFGAPPHGGIAPGLDRLVMLMAGETSIKEVIAFPKNSFAQSPMDDCPGEVEQKQLDELHLAVKG